MGFLTKLLIATSPKIPKAGNLGPGQRPTGSPSYRGTVWYGARDGAF
jgi:hypothetical protein